MPTFTPDSVPGFFASDEDQSSGVTANRAYARDALTLAQGGPRVVISVYMTNGITTVFPTSAPDSTPLSLPSMVIYQAPPTDIAGVITSAFLSAVGS